MRSDPSSRNGIRPPGRPLSGVKRAGEGTGRMALTVRARHLLAASLLCLPLASAAQATGTTARPAMPAGHPPVGGASAKPAPSPWSQFADYTLTVKVPPKGEAGTWKFRTFADPADVLVDLDTPGPRGRSKGSILLVGGQALAVKGFTPEPGYEIDPLDVAIVNLKVLTQLLDAAVPGGPAALKGKQAVDKREAKTPILASTPGANARFDAPWHLKGTAERIDAARVAFRLEIEVGGGAGSAERARWAFSGEATGSSQGRVLDESMSLAGWTAYALGNVPVAKPSSHATLRFGATRLPGPFAALKDLRAALPR